MRQFPRPFTVAARLSLSLVMLLSLMGPLPAAPALAASPASAPAGPTPPPANDDFANAAVITLPPDYTDTQILIAATSQAGQGEPFACGSDTPSVWYAFTPAVTGFYEFDTYGTTITHSLAIYTGASLGELSTLNCASFGPGGTSLGDLFSADVTYWVQVAGTSDPAQAAFQPQAIPQIVLNVTTGAEVSGTVWNDQNGNGVQEGGEFGLPGASVSVLDDTATVIGVVNTDTEGHYSFSGLPISETLSLVFAPPPPGPWLGSPQDVGSDATDSDADPFTGETITFTLVSLESLVLDAGFGAPAEISGRTWRDLNSNDVQDPGEPGLANVGVCLISVDYNCFDSTSTAPDGSYSFLAPAGDYSLAFEPITNFNFATENVGGDADDSDALAADGTVPTFTVSLGDVVAFDAGYQTTGLGDRVWRDLNADGVQDPGEPGMVGVQVELYDSGGVILTTTTDANGEYAFTGLAAGDYAAVFTLPTGNSFAPQDAGGDDSVDSDANPGTGRTITVTLSSGELDLSWDAGMTKPFYIVDNLNEYSDTTPGDALCNDTTSVPSAPYGECSLRAAIEEANADPDFDVILFDSTVFSITQTIPQTSQYLITSSLWIDGPGSAIVNLDAGNNDRNILIQGGYVYDVRLSGLRLANGNSINGGGINNDAHLTLIDIIIAGAGASNLGGGLYSYGDIQATDVVITGSSADYGGGIYNGGYVSSTNLLLAGNTAIGGGGLDNEGLFILAGGNITGNVATADDGGGVINFGAFLASASSIQHNIARWDGGGIANLSSKNLAQAEPATCLVANGCGPEYTAAITLTDQTNVNANVAGVPNDYPAYGGGIYNGAGALLVDNSQVFDNTVYGYGGGIYNEGSYFIYQTAVNSFTCFTCAAVATIQNGSLLATNVAVSTTVVEGSDPVVTTTFPSLGGGLYNLGLVFVDASTILSNTANQGGGFFNDYLYSLCFCGAARAAIPASDYVPTLFIANSSAVTGNTAVLEGDASFSGLFTGDNAGGLGGGGFNSGQAYLTESLVDQNTADLLGGGLFNGVIAIAPVSGSQAAGVGPASFGQAGLPFVQLNASGVNDNTADPGNLYFGAGGGVFNFIGDVEVNGGTVNGNTASLWGGGIANGCIFCLVGSQSGAAEPQGPGILLLFGLLSELYVHDGAQIAYNAADPDALIGGETAGGGVFNSGFAVIADSAVTTNTTSGVGGGILNLLYLTLDHTNVDDNVATYAGGGIYNLDLFLVAQAQAAASAALTPAGFFGLFFFGFAPGQSVEAPLVIRNGSTVSNNRADPNDESGAGDGGGIFTSSPALISDSTVADNWSAGNGAGLAVGLNNTLALSAAAPACLGTSGSFFPITVDRVILNNTIVSTNHAGWIDSKGELEAVGGGVYVFGDGCADLPFEANASLLDGNTASAGGGGIYVDFAEAYLHNTNLLNNNGDDDQDGLGNGGASYNNGGYLVIDPANVIGNSAQYGGGGYYDSGTTLITQTTFATNTAVIQGGGLMISGTADVTVGNSTLSANMAGGTGSAIFQRDDTTSLTLANVTIANNNVGALSVAGGGTAGYFRSGTGPVVINNTIIYGNGGASSDCTFTNPATNVSGVANMGDASCVFIPGWTTANPLLGPLQYNGGPNGILTHALGSLSPALDAANTGVCGASPVDGVDERNVLRLLDLACDIGAYEFESLTAIELVSFTATDDGGLVQLAWETAVEIDTAGFNLYRAAAPGGPYVQINALLIAAQGPQGGSYTAQDAPGVGTWYYKLEDVDTNGIGTLHGPAQVTVGSGANSTHVIFLPLIGNK